MASYSLMPSEQKLFTEYIFNFDFLKYSNYSFINISYIECHILC